MKTTKKQMKKGFTLVELLVVIAIIAVLAGIATPLIMNANREGARAEALNNAKSVAGGLMKFKMDRGSYPSAFTREALEDRYDNLPEGTDANAYLAQLVVTGIIDSEGTFYAPGVRGAIKGDDLKAAGKLLAQGENSFAYIMGENENALMDDSSMTPLVIAPLLQAGERPTFDDKVYAGKYVYGVADGSGKVGEVSKDGQASARGRDSLFQTGADSLFGRDVPVLKAPTGF